MKLSGLLAMAKAFIAAQPSPSMNTPVNPQLTPQSESLRRLMTLALFGAGIVCTVGAAAMVLIIWLGGWTDDTQAQRLEILSYALLGMLAGVLAVIVSFAIGGPVGRLKGGIGLATFEASSGSEPVAQVTTTTTVDTVAIPADDKSSD
jgi:fructose-specific phosphotransferase system IIC component